MAISAMEVSLEGTTVHAPSSEFSEGTISRGLLQLALDANKRLQQTLSQRAETLEAELREADQLLSASSVEDGQDDPESEVSIPGAKKAVGLFPPSEFLNPASPFYADAAKRSAYISDTNPHPMKAKDLEVLAGAVRRENERLQAYHQRSGPSAENETTIDLNNNLEGLDWTRIAERVSDSSSVKRSAVECRITWIADRHPGISHAEWSDAEVDRLNTLLYEHAKNKEIVNWVGIAKKLGTNRTPIDCMRQSVPRHRHFWSTEADQRLIKAVQSCGVDNWPLVARRVSESATGGQCQTRWYKSVDPGLKRGSWTEEEDNRLRKAVAGFGTSWMQVAAAIPGRTNDQCRERWVEQINPSASKLVWTEEEDKVLIESVKELGHQWKAVSLKVGNSKTGPNCRMRYDKLKRSQNKQAIPVPGPSSVLPVSFQTPISTFPEIQPAPPAQSVESSSQQPFLFVEPISKRTPKPRPVGKGKAKETNAEPSAATNPDGSTKDAEDILPTSVPTRGNLVSTLQTPDGLGSSDRTIDGTPKLRPKPRPQPRAKDPVTTEGAAEAVADKARQSIEISVVTPAEKSPRTDEKDTAKMTSSKGGRKRKADDDEAQIEHLPKRTQTTRASRMLLTPEENPISEDAGADGTVPSPRPSTPPSPAKRGRKRKLDAGPPMASTARPSTTGANEVQAGHEQAVSALAPSAGEDIPGPDANAVAPAKRKRGRPRKVPAPPTPIDMAEPPGSTVTAPVGAAEPSVPPAATGEPDVPVKRGRGRPRKVQRA